MPVKIIKFKKLKNNPMWLVHYISENTYKGFYSFNRLKKELGLPSNLDKPKHPLKIGDKFLIIKIQIDERI